MALFNGLRRKSHMLPKARYEWIEWLCSHESSTLKPGRRKNAENDDCSWNVSAVPDFSRFLKSVIGTLIGFCLGDGTLMVGFEAISDLSGRQGASYEC
jgi:hypothetical protein